MESSTEIGAAAPERDPALPRSIGRYEVVRVLGEGAMGRVLLARDPVLDRDVAVKHLRADLQLPRDVKSALLTRMRHEARAAARVAHPNLVVLHDMGEDADLGLFLVFEFVDGPTLKDRLLEGAVGADEAARLARELGAALTLAHRAGVLHRDVKPENVMLAPSGAKVADFGIARVPDSTLTHHGGLLGTPAYSAPETFDGGAFSPASDQFSLAATLYEAISGRRAFPGEDAITVAAKIKTDTPAPFADDLGLSAEVDRALLRAMSREPDDRFASCEAFGEALARAVSGEPSVGRGAAAPPRDQPPRQRKLSQVLIGAGVVVVTAILLVRAALHAAERGEDEVVSPPDPRPSATSPEAPAATTASPAPARRHGRPREAAPSAAPAVPASASAAAPPSPSTSATAAASASVPSARASASAPPPPPPKP